jgi:DsbC/DsbD-like thiol-disulfide interchange protein
MYKMRRLVRILFFALLCAASVNAEAESIQARHARVELVSAQSDVAPGGRILLGLHFSLEKNWHIYWTNPGDSGQPPVLQWQLPSGVEAGAVEWPLPEKLVHSTLADYGYEGDVVLLVPMRVTDALKKGEKQEIGLAAKWLICSDVCIPDHAQLHLSLPLTQDPVKASLLSDNWKRLPKPWPTHWKARVLSGKSDFVVFIASGRPIEKAQFLPLVPDQIENAAPQTVKSDSKGAAITLRKSDQLLKPISVLKGILVIGDGDAYTMEAPVAASPAQAHRH